MRIVFVSDHFSTPNEPGILRTWQVAKHLADEGDEVVVIAPSKHYLFTGPAEPSAGEVAPERVQIVRMRTSPVRRGSALSRLRCYAEQLVFSAVQTWRAGRCDVVVAGLTPSMLGIGAFCAARLRRVPFVVDERDLALDAAQQAGLLPRPVLWVAQRVERFLHARSARVITVTPGLRALLLERGLPDGKVVLAVNGYDGHSGAMPSVDRDELRKRMGWDGRTVVLYAGGLGYMYDLDVVLDAAARLDSGRFLVVIMGEGERKVHYVQRCEREKLPADFPMPVPKAEVAGLCRAADICVVPLRNLPWAKLAISNKLIDYLGAGRPVVVTGPGDTADLVGKAGAGIAVPAEDPEAFAKALESLAADPAGAERMGAAGREFVLRSWTRAASVRGFRSALVEAAGRKEITVPGGNSAEHERIRAVYAYYDSSESEQRKRDGSNAGVRLNAVTRWAALQEVLDRLGLRVGASVLDVGCGSGGDLQRIAAEYGYLRPRLHGVDLLPDRIERAQRALPGAMLRVGSAERLDYPDQQFDVVIASTVFSSILDGELAQAVAREMTRVLAEEGVILCYDTRYPNPTNPHTRAIGQRQLQQLFPWASVRVSSVTLLPPLARRLGALSAIGYRPLRSFPLLRSHYLAEVRPTGLGQGPMASAEVPDEASRRPDPVGVDET
ncbi:MAG TPA: glycosyltransferase [Streptosporangiaceae bacterium]|nr:glycosyltransferase [Streptosporangiaceae bacterium]